LEGPRSNDASDTTAGGLKRTGYAGFADQDQRQTGGVKSLDRAWRWRNVEQQCAQN